VIPAYADICLSASCCQEYQAVVDAEWSILYNKLDKIHQSGAKVVLSKLPIGDVATQYFADRSGAYSNYNLSYLNLSICQLWLNVCGS